MTEQTQSGDQGNTVNPDNFYSNQVTADQEENKETTSANSDQSNEDQTEASNDDKADSNESDEGSSEDVELELPEGSSLSKEHLEELKSFAKDNEISMELAKKLLDREEDLLDSYKEAQEKMHEQIIDTWKEQSLKDPEIGGDNLKQNLENCKRVIEKFGSEEFKKQLSETGYGNHPEVVRIFSKIGKLLQDDTLINPSATSGQDKSIEEIFYGKNN